MQTVTLVLPMREEAQAFHSALSEFGHAPESRRVGRLDCCWYEALHLLVAVGGHGKTQFGVQTQHLLERVSPCDLLICAGASGSLDQRIGVGDLVIGTEIVEHDYTLRFDQRPLP